MKCEMRIVLVRSVRSKASTAPPFFVLRLLTQTTSPSTVTRPLSRVSVSIFTGFCLIARPKSTSPFAPPLAGAAESKGWAATFGRG